MSPAPDDTDVPSNVRAQESRTGRLLVVAVVTGVIASGAFIAGLVVRGLGNERVPALSIMAAVLLGLKLGLDRAARWAAPSQGVVATSLAAAGLAPLFGMGALWAMSDPLVASTFRCGTGDMMLITMVPVVLFFGGSLGILLAAGFLAGGRGEALRPLIRGAALLATLAAAALVGLSVARAVRKPDVDRYVDSLPVTDTLPPVTETLGPRPVQKSHDEPRAVPTHTDVLGDIAVYRACWSDSCDVAVADASVLRGSLAPHELRSLGAPGELLSVRRDEAHRFVVIEGSGRIAFGVRGHFPDAWPSSRGRSVVWPAVDIGVRDVASSASPPLGWILGGAAGLLAACALLAASAMRSRRMRAVLHGVPGVLGENGWIHFEDGRPSMRADPAAGVAPGPVLVIEGTRSPGAYRESDVLGASQLVAGTRAEWDERAAAGAANLHAWAIATATLGAAPLAAAASAGLVW